MIANTAENVGDLPLGARRIANAICRQQRQFQLARDFDHGMIASFFIAIEMALQFGINVFAIKDFNQLFGGSFCFAVSAVVEIVCERSIFRTRQTHQTFGILS